jgi:CHAT domain-containing protein
VAFGFEARRDRVLAGELAGHSILHFATHGLLNGEHPELSGLVLSQFDESAQPIKGFLASHDVASLRLSADLVVLSACRTALGREIRGEGLHGLAQAFLIAGARQVLVSLWRVDDRSAAALMERFYRRLFMHGEGAAAALAGAQRSLRDETSFRAPAHWAGFILFGGDSRGPSHPSP